MTNSDLDAIRANQEQDAVDRASDDPRVFAAYLRRCLRLTHHAATLAAARGVSVWVVIAEWRRQGDHANADAAVSGMELIL